MIQFIIDNWLELLIAVMAFLKVVTNLTPTKYDEGVFIWVDKIIIVFIPNYDKKGGKHNKINDYL